MRGDRLLAGALAVPLAAILILGIPPTPVGAQSALSGASITPVYEGFWRNEDGSFDLLFGYFNRNWEEALYIPIGPENLLEPGGPDVGQPTHFFPRRSQFVFRVRVPADFGDGEVVWTLTANGETHSAYGTLRPEYAVDDVVMSANFGAGGQTGFNPSLEGNLPPEVTVEGGLRMTTQIGEPVTLSAIATDDGRPTRRGMPASAIGQNQFVPNSATGLRFSWVHYRGPGTITFDPPQTRVWQDNRDGANSPWAAGWSPPPIPPDNRWTATATFHEPGTYVVRALASDGGLVAYEDVTVIVSP